MSDDDRRLRKVLRQGQAQSDGAAPDFATVFAAAERQMRTRHWPKYSGYTAAATITVMAMAIALLPGNEDKFIYVDVDELAATTSWSAPSDSLLPNHQFDIYRDLPRLFESTNSNAGALL